MAPVKGWDVLSEQSFLNIDVLGTGNMGKNLSAFDKDQIMMVRRLGQGHVGLFVVCSGQYLPILVR